MDSSAKSEELRTLCHILSLRIFAKGLLIASALVRWLAFNPALAKMSRVQIGFGLILIPALTAGFVCRCVLLKVRSSPMSGLSYNKLPLDCIN